MWDLDETTLQKTVLDPRLEGTPIYRGGQEFAWPQSKVNVYAGPARAQVEGASSPLMTPSLLAMTGLLRDVTDEWITGPAGATEPPAAAEAPRSGTGLPRYQVFLSSTYKDLTQERADVTQALLKAGRYIPAGMELFNASGLPPWEVITRVLDVTDYFVLVIGHRYVADPKLDGLSYTEREYDYAMEQGLVVLPFLTTPDRPVRPDDMDDAAGKKALIRFREKIQAAHTTESWSSGPQLASAVTLALATAVIQTPRPGWVRADDPRA